MKKRQTGLILKHCFPTQSEPNRCINNMAKQMKYLKELMSRVKNRSGKTPIEEAFVTLIQVAKETPDIRDTLLSILQKDEFQRSSMINTLMEEMRYKGAPGVLITAISSLLDDRVAQKALELLKE